MSVVSTWEPVPNRIEAVVRYLSENRGVTNDELYALFSPASLTSSDNLISRVVSESQRLGIIERDDKQRWNLTDRAAAAKNVRALIQETLLSPELAMDAGQAWVSSSIAWFLTKDPREPLPLGENWRTRVERDFRSESVDHDLKNQASCEQFAYWVVYLGFGWRLAMGEGETLVPDPSVALESAMRATMEVGQQLLVGEMIERVASVCSVMEGGKVRQRVEEGLVPERQRPDGRLSRSTSLALTRLESSKVVSMPSPLADAVVTVLDLWPERRRVSHIRLNEAAA